MYKGEAIGEGGGILVPLSNYLVEIRLDNNN